MRKRMLLAVVVTSALALSAFADQVDIPKTLDFDTLWNYSKPAETRVKFVEVLNRTDKQADLSYYLQLQTQVARTLGLNQMYDSAHALLEEVESQLSDDLPIVRIRYLLERGRTINTSGDPAQSKPLFIEAFDLADSIGADFYTVDAAHMVGIVGETREERLDWNLKGLEVAEKSVHKRARHWLGSIYNNVGWDYHDHGEFEKALDLFEKALAFRIEQGDETTIGIARWCVARTLRSLGRYDEAMAIQLALAEKNKQSGNSDGFVWEELGELYLIKADTAMAVANFAKAYTALAKYSWIEAERLERIKKLGKVEKK